MGASRGPLGFLREPWGPPEAPGGPRTLVPDSPRGASGPIGFGACCFATQEGRKCSRVPGQQHPEPPEPQGMARWV